MREPRKYFNKTFRQDYLFFCGWPKDEYLRYCKTVLNVDDDKDISFGETFRCSADHDHAVVMWVEDMTRTDLISHECLHGANYTLAWIGAKACFKNDEVQAYLLQELVREFTS